MNQPFVNPHLNNQEYAPPFIDSNLNEACPSHLFYGEIWILHVGQHTLESLTYLVLFISIFFSTLFFSSFFENLYCYSVAFKTTVIKNKHSSIAFLLD